MNIGRIDFACFYDMFGFNDGDASSHGRYWVEVLRGQVENTIAMTIDGVCVNQGKVGCD
jgi:hypothetical protein